MRELLRCAANIVRFSETSACLYLFPGGRAGFEGVLARVSLGQGCSVSNNYCEVKLCC